MYRSFIFCVVPHLLALTLILQLPYSTDGCCIASWRDCGPGQLRVHYRCDDGTAPTRRVKLNRHSFFHFINISTPSARDLLYVAATPKVFLSFSPELWDALTFNALLAKKRIATYHVQLPSIQACPELSEELGNEDVIADLLLGILHEQSYVKQLEQTLHNKSCYEAVSDSGVFLFMPLGLVSIFYVFVVFPCVRNHVLKQLQKRGPLSTFFRRLSTVKDGVHLASVMVLASLVVFWTYNAARYYTSSPNSPWNLVATNETPITPFTVNLAFLFLTLLISFVASLGFHRPSRGALKETGTRRSCTGYCVVSCFGSACLIALVTCLTYHSLFLLVSVVLDWTTAVSNLTTWITIIIMIYLAIPMVLHQLHVTRATRQYGPLVLVFTLASTTPGLYYACLIGFDNLLREDSCTTTRAQLTVVLALSSVCVILQGVLFLLVLKLDSAASTAESGGVDVWQRQHEEVDVEAGKKRQRGIEDEGNHGITQLPVQSQGKRSVAFLILTPSLLDSVLHVITTQHSVPPVNKH